MNRSEIGRMVGVNVNKEQHRDVCDVRRNVRMKTIIGLCAIVGV